MPRTNSPPKVQRGKANPRPDSVIPAQLAPNNQAGLYTQAVPAELMQAEADHHV
jgi:hypothetical protein